MALSRRDSNQVIERAARESFGRLVAFLSSRSGDIAGAEDALADAFATALERWPLDGLPAKPEAWLLAVARRRMLDRYRHAGVVAAASQRLLLAHEEAQAASEDQDFPDDRLKLMLACAHPAIERGVRTALILQVALGLDAASIASAFLVSPQAMTKRLGRAKLRLRELRVPLTMPTTADLPDRRDNVLAAIYAAFTLGHGDADLAARGGALAQEAVWLGRVTAQLLGDDPEARGLLALMLFSHSRKAARYDREGRFLPLDRQPPDLWNEDLIVEAEAMLREAGRLNAPGRFQYEAAIQAVHAARRLTGQTDWQTIAQLYDGLILHCDNFGARVARAAAMCEAGRPLEALTELDALNGNVDDYQPYWAVRGHVLQVLARSAEANEALSRAAGLTENAAVRAYLLSKRS